MRVIFAGTPAFAAQALEAIIAAGHEVALVLTQPDRPAGRGMKLKPPAVKDVALSHGLAVNQPARLKDPASHAAIRAAAADVMVVAAYGLILPQAVLDIPCYGCLNIHASLLPRWRGAAPIHRAIEAGDARTGITIMQMDAGLDTGPCLLSEAVAIAPDETTGSLHDRLASLGGRLIVAALAQLDRPGGRIAQPQPSEGVSYAAKIDKAEAELDWRLPAAVLARKVRAFNPFPGAWAVLAGETIKVWRADPAVDTTGDVHAPSIPGAILPSGNADAEVVVACGTGALRLLEVQRPGGRRIGIADYLRRKSAGGAG